MANSMIKEVCDMKKKLIFLFITLLSITLFSACGNGKKENNMVKYESGIYYDKNWDETVGTYTESVIPDKDTALEVATVIFNGMDKSRGAKEYVPKSVFYDDQDEIWIVSFGKNSNQITLGGDCNIAMQKKDGKVLRIWFGE